MYYPQLASPECSPQAQRADLRQPRPSRRQATQAWVRGAQNASQPQRGGTIDAQDVRPFVPPFQGSIRHLAIV